MATAMRFAGSELYIPSSTLPATKAITAISKATPGVFTAVAHGYNNGDIVYIDGVVGMTEVNGIWGVVTAKATDTFQLTVGLGVLSTSSYTTYSSGGTAQGYTMARMCEAKSINSQGGSVEQIDTTGMCDSSKTYEARLSDTGSFSVSANKLAQGAVQISLRTNEINGTKFPVKIVFPNSATNGSVMVPVFVQSANWQGAVGQAWAADFSFKKCAGETYFL